MDLLASWRSEQSASIMKWLTSDRASLYADKKVTVEK